METSHTNTVLLAGLFDPRNEAVWREFDERYRSILVGFARRLGLQEEDAADVAQETLAQFVRDYRANKYDRSQGRLHSWVLGIARHRVADLRRKAAARKEQQGATAIGRVPDEDHFEQVWDEECRRAILDRSLERLRVETRLDEQTIRAFEMVAIEQQSASTVAESLDMSIDSVYAAKHRCLTQIRGFIQELNEAYEL
jgi:RNA polymerase sigma-70 factor (ECF subfamily)